MDLVNFQLRDFQKKKKIILIILIIIIALWRFCCSYFKYTLVRIAEWRSVIELNLLK